MDTVNSSPPSPANLHDSPSPLSPLSYSLQTFGCKLNTYDSGVLQKHLSQAGFSLRETETPRHIHIINTCAVTAEATKESLKRIRQLKVRSPHSIIVVTGCAAQVDTECFVNNPHVDLVVANSHKGQIQNIVHEYLKGRLKQRVFKSNIFKKNELEAGGGVEKNHTRSFLKIQDGCNSFCTFCVIPFARGKSRSLDTIALIRRVCELYDEGVRETVLTGVHIGDYMDSQGNQLEDLVEALITHTPMPRLRLSSLEPIECSERLLDLYSDPKMCPHVHLSVQSVQTDILRAMKRRYDARKVEAAFDQITKKIPQAFIGLDMIVGFPSETEQQFNEAYERMEQLPWTKIHVFPYSPRPGTYANKIKGALHRHDILKRAKKLRRLSDTRYNQKAMDQVGKIKEVMILKSGQEGLSEDYWPVSWSQESWPWKSPPTGTVIPVRVTDYRPLSPSHSKKSLLGEPVPP